MKLIKNTVIILFILCSVAFGQDITPEDSVFIRGTFPSSQKEISHIHFQFTIGMFEFSSVGVGYNIDSKNSLLFKMNLIPYRHDKHPGVGIGYGIKYTYSIPDSKLFKNISIAGSLLSVNEQFARGVQGFAVGISTERTKSFYSWIVLQYEFGATLTKYRDGKATIWPVGKIGFNINF